MKTVMLSVTQDDLDNAQMFNINDCAGYRSAKRMIPSTYCFGFETFFVTNADGIRVAIEVPKDASSRLSLHATERNQQPFSFEVQVPDDVPSITLGSIEGDDDQEYNGRRPPV